MIEKKGTNFNVNINDFKNIKISLMSPEEILARSYGEVKNFETLNYKSGKPEKDGLFCERIFGPVRDWACSCGKHSHDYNYNKPCENCGTMVTKSIVRRERFGHIDLQAPVVHIIFYKSNSSILGTILDMQVKVLEKIIYYASYIILDPKDTPYSKYDIINEKEYKNIINTYGRNAIDISIGGEAILKMLQDINMEEEVVKLEEALKKKNNPKTVKRLNLFKEMIKNKIKPEWIVLTRVPVLPPDIRPMIQITGGRFATSDANDLYRKLITRNNRLKKMIEAGTPDVIVRHEKRLLQEAVDCLFANGKRGDPVTATNGRPFKSIADNLHGKNGIFRMNLLGKRVDYSGRSVIVVGPELKMNQCGLPKKMALELYKPYVLRELIERGIVNRTKTARKMIESFDNRVWDILDDVIKGKPVLLNRAPTLHRISIQGFDPVLIEGDAIRLHPLVCSAYNADFDGDQMAVHLPISKQAREETYGLMLAPHNILSPKDGQTIAVPSQDMIIGIYYLTIEDKSEKVKLYKDEFEAKKAFDTGHITLHQRIVVNSKRVGAKVITTAGKIILSDIFPEDFAFANDNLFEKYSSNEELVERITSDKHKQPFGTKGKIKTAIDKVYELYGEARTVDVIDKMKALGFKYATIAGVTVGMDDIVIPEEKSSIISSTEQEIEYIVKLYNYGFLTDQERYQATVDLWSNRADKLTDIMMKNYEDNHRKNPLYMMVHSGARGSKAQVKQLSAMRGLMSNTVGKTIEFPIKANFKEGISILDYFTSSHGARKGGVDTALKTADSGYLTRRLVDAAQGVIIQEDDCHSEGYIVAKNVVNDGTTIINLYNYIAGNYSAEDVVNSNGDILVKKNELISKNIAQKIVDSGIKEVKIRSVRKCNNKEGLCRHCYGVDLANWQPVKFGTAVGIIAAQSIGEPGTQLTMRTFHTGGVAGNDITQGLPRVEELVEAMMPVSKVPAAIAPISGTVNVTENGRVRAIAIENPEGNWSVELPLSVKILVRTGDIVERGHVLTGGALKLQEALDILGKDFVEEYILHEIIKVYATQGVSIAPKHIEVIVKQMLKKVMVEDPGDSIYHQGQVIDIEDYYTELENLQNEGKAPLTVKQQVTGITKIASNTKSYLSAASFQESLRILPNAAIKGSVDNLQGLKENLLIGRLIPAGTGFSVYRDLPENEKYLDMKGDS